MRVCVWEKISSVPIYIPQRQFPCAEVLIFNDEGSVIRPLISFWNVLYDSLSPYSSISIYPVAFLFSRRDDHHGDGNEEGERSSDGAGRICMAPEGCRTLDWLGEGDDSGRRRQRQYQWRQQHVVVAVNGVQASQRLDSIRNIEVRSSSDALITVHHAVALRSGSPTRNILPVERVRGYIGG